MTPRDRNRLRGSVLLVAILVTLAVPAGSWLLLQDWARARLTGGLLEHAQEVQREVRETVTYAADLGIPLDAEEVVHSAFAYLAGVLQDNPQVRFIAVARPPPGVDLLFYEGTNRRRLGRLLSDPDVEAAAAGPGGSGDRALPVGNFAILVEPLALEDEPPFAVLHVGVDRRFAEARLATVVWPLLLATLGGLVLAVQAALFAVDGLIAPPLDRLTDRLAHGGLAGRAQRRGRRRDEIGAVLRARAAAIDRLRDAYGRLMTYADEVGREVFDPRIAEQVAQLRSRTEAELAPLFEPAEPPPGRLARAARLQPALFSLAAALVLPLADGAWRVGIGSLSAWPILAALLALAIGATAAGPARRLAARPAVALGAGLAAMAAWFSWGIVGMPGWLAPVGMGAGLVPAVAVAGPRGAALPLCLGAVFGGLLAGSLAGVTGASAADLTAAVLATLALAAGLALPSSGD
jgi:hypothetical protein